MPGGAETAWKGRQRQVGDHGAADACLLSSLGEVQLGLDPARLALVEMPIRLDRGIQNGDDEVPVQELRGTRHHGERGQPGVHRNADDRRDDAEARQGERHRLRRDGREFPEGGAADARAAAPRPCGRGGGGGRVPVLEAGEFHHRDQYAGGWRVGRDRVV